MLDPKEIDIEIARLEYGESSYPAYAKLADLYTIRDQIQRSSADYERGYSAAPPSESNVVTAQGNSDFLMAVEGRDQQKAWFIMDELMDTLQVVNPKVYAGVMRKIYSL